MYIYKTTNLINGNSYIGKTNGNTKNYYGSGTILQKALKKYGKENFKVEIIEETSSELINEREIYWINKFKPTYNIAKGGEGGNTSKYMNEKQKQEYYYKKGKKFRENNPMKESKHRNRQSKYMKENNPNKGGAWNHTAYPVKVIFNDGSTKKFEYMKQISEILKIPYSSIKVARRMNLPLKKYNIKEIIKI